MTHLAMISWTEGKQSFVTDEAVVTQQPGWLTGLRGTFQEQDTVDGTKDNQIKVIHVSGSQYELVLLGKIIADKRGYFIVETHREFDHELRDSIVNIRLKCSKISVLVPNKQCKALAYYSAPNTTIPDVLKDLFSYGEKDRESFDVSNPCEIPDWKANFPEWFHDENGNEEQMELLSEQFIKSKWPRNFVLMGPPGTGKTYTLCLFIHILAKHFLKQTTTQEQGVVLTCQTNNACIEAYKRLT
jgi:hypothetical protein